MNFSLWKLSCCRVHLSTCIVSWNWKYYSLRTDLVLEKVCEEFHRLRPSRFPSKGLTGSQESGLSFRVAPVDMSPAFHQQADQAKLTWGCCTDEGAAVWQGVPHGLEGKGRSDYIFSYKHSLCYNILILTAKHLYCQPWTSFTCYHSENLIFVIIAHKRDFSLKSKTFLQPKFIIWKHNMLE